MKRIYIVLSVFFAATLLASAAFAADILLSPVEQLGKFLYFDKLSEPGSMACADCHAPRTGFTGPNPGINKHGAVYRGAVAKRFGNRKPPSAAYATLSPIFHFDAGKGCFVGGNFWDGRATGDNLGNPAADQALGPFLNPVEQNNPSKLAVVEKVAASKYAGLWADVWGEPISTATPGDVEMNYDRIGLSIAAFEDSREVNQFSSKFDVFWVNANDAGMDVRNINMMNWMTFSGLGFGNDELRGLALFNDETKGMCALCHVLDPYVDTGGTTWPPAFTDFTFDNLGVPKNPKNPFYKMDKVYLGNGSPINPLGADWVDLGLGGFLEAAGMASYAAENYGKHKVPTLRNVDLRPGARTVELKIADMDMPGPEKMPKAYMHNGVFKSLKEVVHFYNTRDVEDWPEPEVADNVNTDELGDLGLTEEEENLIVLFMQTLNDGYTDPYMPMVAIAAGSSLGVTGANPFNPTTTIGFNLARAGNVRLDVYNVAGQKVSTLVNGWKDAGDHSATFVASSLPSGVYFVRLSGVGPTMTTKLVLLK